MTQPRIEERTLYEPIIGYLKNIGFAALGETKLNTKHPDILFKVNNTSFVIEVKIGRPEIGLKAVAQAADYAKTLGTQNIIVLIYPEEYRNQTILFPEKIDDISLRTKLHALMLTEFWTEAITTNAIDLFDNLKAHIIRKRVKHDFQTIVNLIDTFVTDLNYVIYQIKTEELVSEVVDKLDLFTSIGEIKDVETARKQVINLASYLLFNQLLFYHIFEKKKKGTKKLSELNEIENIDDIKYYFKAITKIDYRSIYRINILDHIPKKAAVIYTLNNVIKSIKLLRAEHITHDLAGRFFHDLIPFEVRKILAAFYTHPIAAEILAGLTIDSWDQKVIDPACGSGTLLVSSYKRKQELYKEQYGSAGIKRMHKKFIEEDITGIDLMPFAAHLTTINLTTQNIEQETNIVRIATKDSLSLSRSLRLSAFKKQGVKIFPYTKAIQDTLFKVGAPRILEYGGAMSPEGKGEEFYIKPVDVVLMNPPFSARDKMPAEMRNKLKSNSCLIDVCGNAINLWGYFLALAQYLLKPTGKIGCVIPINIARGTTTEKIRNFIFHNYRVKYIIKSVKDFAFSEGASFKDILFVAEKTKPKKDDVTAIVFFTKSIRDMDLFECSQVVKRIKRVPYKQTSILKDKYFCIRHVKQSQLNADIDNLMYYIGGSDFENMDIIKDFKNTCQQLGQNKLSKLKMSMMKEGITSPKGLSQLVYLTRPTDPARIRKSFLVIRRETEKHIIAQIKNSDLTVEIPKKCIRPALRTLTGIKKLDITKTHDYIVTKTYKGFAKVKTLSKWKGDFNWRIINEKIGNLGESKLVIPDKINLSSPNTFMLSAFSKEPMVLSNLFFTYKNLDRKWCEVMAFSLNSVLTIAQFITFKSETLGSYIRLSANDWALTYQLDYGKLGDRDRKSLARKLKKLRTVDFPPLIEQLKTKFWGRIELDSTFLKLIGFTRQRISSQLPLIYDALVRELESFNKKRVKQEKFL
jgi:hypothetical protein